VRLAARVRQKPRRTVSTASGGRLLAPYSNGAFAEFERAMIRERTSAGLAAARAKGKRPAERLDRRICRDGRQADDAGRREGQNREGHRRLRNALGSRPSPHTACTIERSGRY
jgi:DNA invertase Pin-like site-specific DNA recombinase